MATSAAVTVGATVRAELARRGHNQQWLGDRIGLSQGGVSRRLLGQVAFDVHELELVAACLDMQIHELIPAPVEVAA